MKFFKRLIGEFCSDNSICLMVIDVKKFNHDYEKQKKEIKIAYLYISIY